MPRERKYVILMRRGAGQIPDEHLYVHGTWTNEPYQAQTFSFDAAIKMLASIKAEAQVEGSPIRDGRFSIEDHPYSLTGD